MKGKNMAIGVKVDPTLIVSGTVVLLQERHAFVEDEEQRKAGVTGELERIDALLVQDNGAQVSLRYRLKDDVEIPDLGTFVSVHARVSEGSYNGRPYVSLVALGPAYNQLDLIQSKLAA